MDKNFAEKFVADWIEAWNEHDLQRILTHYTEDFEMSSPVIRVLAGEPSGTLRGKKAVGAYWEKALLTLKNSPGARFEKVGVYLGAKSLTLLYRGHRGLSAEVFHFNDQGRVHQAIAHYEQPV